MKHRRNNALAGIIVLIGALLIMFGAVRPWATVTVKLSANLGIRSLGIGLDLAPHLDTSADSETEAFVLSLAVAIGLLSLLLIATRVRVLGIVWRLAILLCLFAPAAVVVILWQNLSRDPAENLNDIRATLAQKFAGVTLSLLEHVGAVDMKPDLGLYVLTLGCALVFVGSCIPAIRTIESRTSSVPPPNSYDAYGKGDARNWNAH